MDLARRFVTLASLVGLAACSSAPVAGPPPVKAPELGTGDHSASSVVLTEIVTASAGITKPRDLAFNPLRPDELWVVNDGDDGVVIVHDASSESRTTEHRVDVAADHFLAFPAAIAFGQEATTFGLPGTFATCGESRNTYGGTMKMNDFTGPALWSSDLSVFAVKDPAGLGSHLDMLHNTPLCMGIAHERNNRYWVFGGLGNSIDLYDFGTDHGIGQDDHTNGEYFRYVAGQVKYVQGVPSHLAFRDDDGMVYVADTGNARVAILDPSAAVPGVKVPTKEPMKTSVIMNGATLTDLIAADSGMLERPSGLEIRGDYVYVSDNANGRISAFNFKGERVNYLDTGLPAGALAGMSFDANGKLYFVDMVGNRVLRIDSRP